MPFTDLTQAERENFLQQVAKNHIPGYTGHCPTLKFRFGKRYGANTREILQELKDVSPVQFTKPYKQGDPELSVLKDTVREKAEHFDPSVYLNLPKRQFILGYTAPRSKISLPPNDEFRFIPGLNFEYGITFSDAAKKSLMKFTKRLADEEKEREKNRIQFMSTSPKMYSVRSRDDVSRTFEENTRHFYNTYVPSVAPELPPIAGYTGHIPGMKGTESSLSRRYYSAAQAGLEMLRKERTKRRHLDLAKKAVSDAITYSHARDNL